jgi:hypothetical protein
VQHGFLAFDLAGVDVGHHEYDRQSNTGSGDIRVPRRIAD